MEREPRPQRSVFSGLPIIILAVFISTGGFAVFLNTRCQAQFNDAWTVVYPNSELITKEMAFLGLQRAVYRTDDAPGEVESWYTRTYLALRETVQETGVPEDALEIAWKVIPADDSGSQINLSRMCP